MSKEQEPPCEGCQWNRLGCGEVEFALGTCSAFLGAQVEELQALVEKLEGRAATNDRNG